MKTGKYERTPKHNTANSKSKKGAPRSSEAQIAADEAKRGVPLPPETCAKMSKAHTGVFHTSEAQLAADKAMKGVPLSPERCAAMSKARKGAQLPPRTPEHGAAISAALKDVPLSPEHCTAIKKGLEKSGVAERQRGGNDLVTHHYIYDESDLSLNTVQMTRSNHTKLHRLLQKLGYIVPHINVKETNGNNPKTFKVLQPKGL